MEKMTEKYPALQYSDSMWEDNKNGILTVECNSWAQFESQIKEYRKYRYYWRGQTAEKPLIPNIYRGHSASNEIKHLNLFKNLPSIRPLKQFLEQRTDSYKKAFKKHCEMVDPENKCDLKYEDFDDCIYWAVGQHHGLKTPILDWTRNPYIALFFAFCKKKEKDAVGKRVVYGLAEKSRLLLKKIKPEKRYIEFLDSLDFIKTALNCSKSKQVKEQIDLMFSRIDAQQGLFTRTYKSGAVEAYTKDCFEEFKKSERYKDKEYVFLLKILISGDVRKDFLSKLGQKEISYRTMYPDLQGAALHCNLKLDY